MIYISIDESGSMTTTHANANSNKWFCMSLVVLKDPKKLKRVYRRWISQNIERLKTIDKDNKMFDSSGKFIEIKGSLLKPQDKINLTKFLCRNDYFEVLFIKVDNTKITNDLYENTARAFNYILSLALRHYLNKKILPKEDYYLYVDERNTNTKSIHSLEDYLNIQLGLELRMINSLKVEYRESHCNSFIQIADFFSNLYYSHINSDKYIEIFKENIKGKYFNCNFRFPF